MLCTARCFNSMALVIYCWCNEPNNVGNLSTFHYFWNLMASFFSQLPCIKQSHGLMKPEEVVCTCKETVKFVKCEVEISPVAALCGPGSGHLPILLPARVSSLHCHCPLHTHHLVWWHLQTVTTHQLLISKFFLALLAESQMEQPSPPDSLKQEE